MCFFVIYVFYKWYAFDWKALLSSMDLMAIAFIKLEAFADFQTIRNSIVIFLSMLRNLWNFVLKDRDRLS